MFNKLFIVKKNIHEKTCVHLFPTDSMKRKAWLDALPNKLDKITKYMGICEKHWPPHCRKEKSFRSRHETPVDPPSIFEGIPPSCMRMTMPKTLRNIEKRRISQKFRNMQPDEISEFNILDRIGDWNDFKEKVSKR